MRNRFDSGKLSVCLLALLCWPAGGLAVAGTAARSLGAGLRLDLSPPVVVSLADPSERRWGRHQFISLSPYPGGRLLVRFHAGEDSVRAYGSGQPTFISQDSGQTWASFSEEGLPGAGLVCAMGGGEMLCVPMPKPLDVTAGETRLPEPVGEFFTYRKMMLYPVEKCPEDIKEFLQAQPASRWLPERKAWVKDPARFDIRQRLVWMGPKGEAGLVSGTSFERAPIRVGGELLWADYRALFVMPDGSTPKGFGVSCFVSTDKGKTWTRRATIATANAMPGEPSSMTEPVLAQNARGELVCVIRRTDQKQKSMVQTVSADQGRTWETPRALTELGDLGVMPDLLRLESGPMVLTYGRPGVYLTVNRDGTGKTWGPPLTLVAGDPARKDGKTDGYTALLPLGKNAFLIGYTDFEYPDAQGRKCKAILVRRAELTSESQ